MAESFYISLPYATYAVVVEENVVTQAPPIARWMIGKPWPVCEAWLARKRAQVQPLQGE